MPQHSPKLSARYQLRVVEETAEGAEGVIYNHYQCITFVAPYQDVSFEELRLSDCSLGAKSMINLPFVNVVLTSHQQSVSSERTTQRLRRGRNSILRSALHNYYRFRIG